MSFDSDGAPSYLLMGKRERFGSHLYNYTKDLYVLSIAFFCIFAAWNTVQTLATTQSQALGNAFLFTLYATFSIVAILGPRIVDKLGAKVAMVVGALPYLLGVLSFLAPTDWADEYEYILKVSVGFLVGFGAPLLWTGQGVYLARIASRHALSKEEPSALPELDVLHYSNRTNEVSNAARSEFNGIFFSFFQANGVVGCLGTGLALVLIKGDNISRSLSIVFTALAVICAVGVLIILLCLPEAEAIEEHSSTTRGQPRDSESAISIFETLRLFVSERKMYLMVPIILYNGFSLGFIFGTMPVLAWEKAFGSSFGAFGTAWFYLINTVATYLIGKWADTKSRQKKALILAAICQIAFFLLIIFVPYAANVECKPDGCIGKGSCYINEHSKNNIFPVVPCTPFIHGKNKTSPGSCAKCLKYNGAVAKCDDSLDETCGGVKCGWQQCDFLKGTAKTPPFSTFLFLFGSTLLFAVGDSVWESQIPALLQSLFSKSDKDMNAAMANLKMWQSVGFALQFLGGIPGMPLNNTSLVNICYVCSGLLLLGILTMSFALGSEDQER